MPTKQNVEPKPGPENPKPAIAEYKHQIRFPLPKLLDGLTEDEEQSLQILLVILRRFDGCTTPIEECISKLVFNYGYRALKPDDFDDEIKTMNENWNDAVEVARLFAQEHPELLAASGTK